MIPAAITAMRVTSANPIMSAEAVDAVRCGFRRELSRASARFGGASSDLLQSAYLVPRQDADAFRDGVRRLEAAHPDLTIVCTGPWPPYTFAANGEADA